MTRDKPEDIITVVSPAGEGRPWRSPKEEAKTLVDVVSPDVAKRWVRQRRQMTTGLQRRADEAVN